MKVAVYVRVSTTEQAQEGYSLDAQIERCRAYALSQGWEISETYIEDGESAKDLNRTKLKQLLSDAQKGLYDVLLVYRLDRLTRSVSDLYKLLETLEKYNVKFKSATELYDTTNAMGKLFITLVAALAEWELNNLRERVRFGMEELVRGGNWHGGPVPYGYLWEESQMSIIQEEAFTLRELRKIYMSGEGFGRTAKILNSRGLKRRNDEPWSENSVWYTLDNPFYAGKIRYGSKKKNGKYASRKKDELVDVIWADTEFPTIFTWEEYEEHTARMKRRQQYGTSRKRDYWFSGVIKCARCGAAMIGRPYRNRLKDGTMGISYINYICSGRSLQKGCDLPLLKQTVAQSLIMTYLEKIKITQEEIAAAAETVEKEQRASINEMDDLRKELKAIGERRRKWQYMLAEDLMSEQDFRARKREEDEKERFINDRIEEIKAEEVGINSEFAQLVYELPSIFDQLSDVAKKEVMQTLFTSIYFECDVKNGREASGKGKTLPFRITEVNFN